jgi:hypothetical protein
MEVRDSSLVLFSESGKVFYDCLPVGYYDLARPINPLF